MITPETLRPIFLDNHLLVVNKPPGMPAQEDASKDDDLLSIAREFIRIRFDKPGNVFLGLVHRLDRPASGVMVFARTSKSAARLSEQFREHQVRKTYWALVEGRPQESQTLVHYLKKETGRTRVVKEGKGLRAELSFEWKGYQRNAAFLEIDLKTGRHHQIRAQLSAIGHPLLGDLRYGARNKFDGQNIALHARRIVLMHPTQKSEIIFEADPPPSWKGFISR
ncbi:MAG TPA: RNA pseudouridine synthase [Calditrichia bacterium]|nr:RNA pseudouridine synthase [Calditrichota bacterium]HQV30545.1 RNA pseudouridine synthase [Calditrichia bacterium]